MISLRDMDIARLRKLYKEYVDASILYLRNTMITEDGVLMMNEDLLRKSSEAQEAFLYALDTYKDRLNKQSAAETEASA